jgi:ABC-type uncharacterized transport system involved in gliding motility auxiliary subunit
MEALSLPSKYIILAIIVFIFASASITIYITKLLLPQHVVFAISIGQEGL